VSDGARELPGRPRGGLRGVRPGLALVQSLVVLQALDAAARYGPSCGDGRRQDARREAAHRVGAVPRPRLRDRMLRGPTRRQQLDGRRPLWPLPVDRVPGDPSHGIGPLGERPVEGGRDPCRRLARENAGDTDHRQRVALADNGRRLTCA